jgi:hypothetical protein
MKLHECTFGRMVITESMEVGHIVGVTYNVGIALTGSMSDEEKHERTIPLVRFADGEKGIHHANLRRFKG